jgi:hypothetical protein
MFPAADLAGLFDGHLLRFIEADNCHRSTCAGGTNEGG